MLAVDQAAIEGGAPGRALMEAAGQAVADAALEAPGNHQTILILAGPGNNGGDGYVAARLLSEAGQQVRVAALGEAKLAGDARWARDGWQGDVTEIDPGLDLNADIIIDALFGTGLGRAIMGDLARVIKSVNESPAHRIAVDMPSGISGDTGAVLGVAFKAHQTVTFFRKKRGHFLLPGREYAGELTLHDIGIEDKYLRAVQAECFENHPDGWLDRLPHPDLSGHKYDRGHLVVAGGGMELSGAARLAARAALRAGAGLVTTAVPRESLPVYARQQLAVMSKGVDSLAEFDELLLGKKINTLVIGPGNGVGEETATRTLSALAKKMAVVIDADAISSFKNNPRQLFDALAASDANCVLTPHAGEFARLWPDLDARADKLTAVRDAAARAGAVVLLKGADTVIAGPGGQTVLNAHAPATLATAGSGDVLAGLIGGLLAQRMPALEAAAAAAWMHGEAAYLLGPGLIADDLCEKIPDVLNALSAP